MKKSKKKTLSAVCLILLLVIVGCMLWIILFPNKKHQDEQERNTVEENKDSNGTNAETGQQEYLQEKGLLFPFLSEDGFVQIDSLFQFSGVNPDCFMTFGENVGAIEFTNISIYHLKKCQIEVITIDGANYSFLAEDIPAGMKVIAFDQSNTVLNDNVEWEEIHCTTEIENDDVMMTNEVQVSTEGIEVVIANIGERDLTNLVVTCHCILDDVCYGGSKYEYSVSLLDMEGSEKINAEDCYLGEARVVSLTAE